MTSDPIGQGEAAVVEENDIPPHLDSLEAIERAFSGIFDRLEHQTPGVRGLVLWALSSRWCMGCGLTYDLCDTSHLDCCDGTEIVPVDASMCPTCESIRWDTVRRKDGLPMRDRTSTNSPEPQPLEDTQR